MITLKSKVQLQRNELIMKIICFDENPTEPNFGDWAQLESIELDGVAKATDPQIALNLLPMWAEILVCSCNFYDIFL